ncbi:hypothetical protein BASA81_003090 [Batrachochytrium salamandrivorans]|nr:hypothetical protein BASA81_003090 [Batrachochytrium salamandrivorans]
MTELDVSASSSSSSDVSRPVLPVVKPIAFNPKIYKLNRTRLADRLKPTLSATSPSLVLFRGGKQQERNETDHEELFRQESSFAWAFGVKEPNCVGVINPVSGEATVFFPRYPAEYALWMGELRTLESFKLEYQVDHVYWLDELEQVVHKIKPTTVLTLHGGLNADSGRRVDQPLEEAFWSEYHVQHTAYHHVCELRLIKTELELDLLRQVNRASCFAHAKVMQQCRPGMYEFQLESTFQHECYYHTGCRLTSYTSICACGGNASALHYGHAGRPNTAQIAHHQMLLLDMGGEGHFYASDITNSFPSTGKFSPAQEQIYSIVLAMQWHVLGKIRPGMYYLDLQLDCYRILLTMLKDKVGLLQGDVEEMMVENLGGVFMPHGLGHSMGVDTHDVGGRPEFPEEAEKRSPDQLGLKSLRLTRPLRAGMVVTVEPGLYFIGYLLDGALKNSRTSKFFVKKRLGEFRDFGGVRLEDDVVVGANGIENLTRQPRTVKDVEQWMAGKITDLNHLQAPWSPKF